MVGSLGRAIFILKSEGISNNNGPAIIMMALKEMVPNMMKVQVALGRIFLGNRSRVLNSPTLVPC